MFDLGTRVDWENSPPHIVDLLKSAIPGLRVKEDVTEILKKGGVDLEKVKAKCSRIPDWDSLGGPVLDYLTRILKNNGRNDSQLPRELLILLNSISKLKYDKEVAIEVRM